MPQNLTDFKPNEKIFALFISRSGGGKTTAAATFPKPYILDYDGRIDGITSPAARLILGDKFKDIKYDQFLPPDDSWDKTDRQLEWMNLQGMQTNDKKYKIEREFDTIVFDSMSTFLDGMLNEGWELRTGGRTRNTQERRLLQPFDYRDYGYEATAFKQVMDTLRGLNRHFNVIVTSHIIARFDKPDLRDSRGNVVKASDGESVKAVVADQVEVGEKLVLSNKIAEMAKVYFNEVYRFEKVHAPGDTDSKFTVEFDTDLARSARGFSGKVDITGKDFYEYWKEQIAKQVKVA